jgi:DNA-directed RNA polymerase specialized sigma24 family protein
METAEMLGISSKTVRRLLERGLLRCSSSLRRKIISKKEIERFLRETSTVAY